MEQGTNDDGTKWYAVFTDENGHGVETREGAAQAIITEYDKDGNFLLETVVDLTTPEPAAP